MDYIIDTIKYVVEKSSHVKINRERIDEFVKAHEIKGNWSELTQFPELSDKDKIAYIIIIDSINFCYWGDPKWSIEYEGKLLDGYFAMDAAIHRALKNNVPFLDAKYLSELTANELKEIFSGNTQIPLFDERLRILNEIGKECISRYAGDFSKMVIESKKDVVTLLKKIVETFPSYDDVTMYKGKEVRLFKRAQLAISDIHIIFNGKGYGEFKNFHELNAFADYKIPQILRKLGILEYDKELARKIDNKIMIEKDSEQEIEIRANMIWAIEIIKKSYNNPNMTSSDIDHYLWMLSQAKSPNDKPYHLTKTIYY